MPLRIGSRHNCLVLTLGPSAVGRLRGRLLARPGPSRSVRPPMRSKPHVLPRRKAGRGRRALECQWQRDQLPEAIRELILDDQRLRNDTCWSVFEC